MAVGTIAPSPVFTGFDNNGDPLSGGLLYTYAAGTTTPLATYSDVGLSVANANPVVLDSAGRATVFLSAASYKFLLKTSAGATVWTSDNIGAVPTTTVDLDVAGTAGEALSANDVVYQSDGSNSLTAGRWYKADADFGYASVGAGMIGFVVADIASGASGSIRLVGRLTSLSGLTAGTRYFISATAGALTATPPANARFVGIAESTTVLVLMPNPYRPTTAISGATTIAATDGPTVTVKADATSGNVTIALYSAVGHAGQIVTVKKTDSTANTVTIDPNSTETVDGSTTWVLFAQYESVMLISDGANWLVMAAQTSKRLRCLATNSGALTVTAGNTTALTLDAETFDIGGLHSTSSNTSRLTVPTGGGGFYVIHAQSKAFSLGASTRMRLLIRKNGTTELASSDFYLSADANNDFFGPAVTAFAELAAADYVEMVGVATTNNVQFGEAGVAGTLPKLMMVRLW